MYTEMLTLTKDSDLPLGFDRTMLQAWVDRADSVRLSIIFAFAARYLRLLPVTCRNNLEDLMIESLGHIPAVQDIFSK